MIPIDLTGLRGPPDGGAEPVRCRSADGLAGRVVLRCTPSHGVIADWYVMHPLVLIYVCGVHLNPKCD